MARAASAAAVLNQLVSKFKQENIGKSVIMKTYFFILLCTYNSYFLFIIIT